MGSEYKTQRYGNTFQAMEVSVKGPIYTGGGGGGGGGEGGKVA